MDLKGHLNGIVGYASHRAAEVALLAVLGLASAGCGLFSNPTIPTPTPVPPPAAAAPAVPAAPTATYTPVPPSPTPSPSPSPTAAAPAITSTAVMTGAPAPASAPVFTSTAAVAPAVATSTPPPAATALAAIATSAATSTPVYIVVTATPAQAAAVAPATPYAPPRVASATPPPLPRYEPLNGGYFPTSQHPASAMQTDGREPGFALETLARFNGQIKSGLESVLSAHYPGRAGEVQSWAKVLRGLLDYAVRNDGSDGRVFHKFVLHNLLLRDGSQRYMLEVQRCAPGLPWVNCTTTYAPISAGVFNQVSGFLARMYGWHPDELAPKPLKP